MRQFSLKLCRSASITILFGLLVFSGSASAALEEIVVTARKIEENIQDAPVAITAVTGDMIERLQLQDLSDVSKIAAGLIFDNEFSRRSNRPVIRGQANILGDSGVAYFIDGVYISGSISNYDLNDVERIEVVKGPQSALYGRNTYSGAINIITKSPDEDFGGRIMVEAADDEQYEVSASVRGRFTDNMSGGLNVRWFDANGSFTNQFDGDDIGEQESVSVSGVLQYAPNDKVDIRLRAYYAELEDGQPPLFHHSASQNNCFTDNGTLYGGGGRYYCGTLEPQDINTDWMVQAPDTGLDVDELQVSLRVDYEANEDWTVTSITGYNDTDERSVSDGDYQPTSFQVANFTPGGFPFAGFPIPPFTYAYVGSMVDFTFANQTDTEELSQEVRFAFEGDRFDAIAGVYYYKQNRDDRSIRDLPANAGALAGANFGAEFAAQAAICAANPICGSIVPFFGPAIAVPRDTNDLEIENQAVFGMIKFDISDDVGLTLEGRYQDETIEQTAIVQDLGSPAEPAVNSTATFSAFTPRVTLDWQVCPDNLLYITYAEGTKPGGFNSTVAIEDGLPTFDEEDVESIEIGSKNTFLDGRALVNVAAFFNQIEGYQLTQNARSGANTTSATVNAGDADIMGIELETAFKPASIDGLTFTFNYAWTDSEFTAGVDQNQGVLNDVADDGLVNCSTGNQFPGGACTSAYGSIDGNQIPRTAENMAFFDVEYRAPAMTGEWFIGANASYEDSKFSQVHNLIETGDTTLINARAGYTTDSYSITLWGKNLNGEDSVPNVLRYADGADSFKRSFVGSQRRDTYFGITAAYNF